MCEWRDVCERHTSWVFMSICYEALTNWQKQQWVRELFNDAISTAGVMISIYMYTYVREWINSESVESV